MAYHATIQQVVTYCKEYWGNDWFKKGKKQDRKALAKRILECPGCNGILLGSEESPELNQMAHYGGCLADPDEVDAGEWWLEE